VNGEQDPSNGQRWLLPDGVEEWLPSKAQNVERVRRELLDLYFAWGYELVVPPMLEYLESLLTGFGSDLDLQTFKVIDQATGRLMGLRADVTSQVARIDAHSLRREGASRLCYAESVLHARPAMPFASRVPMLVGAELFGAEGPAADAEVVALLAETLARVGAVDPRIELGHVGIFRAVSAEAGLTGAAQRRLFDALQCKSQPDLDAALGELDVEPALAVALRELPGLMGGTEVLDRAERLFADGPHAALAAVQQLRDVARQVALFRPATRLQFDLCELSGYTYHSGVVFAAYVQGEGQAVARGGRYDGIGAAFGRARPATGFDADLAVLAALGAAAPVRRRVLAPAWPEEPARQQALHARVAALRAEGVAVLHAVGGVQPQVDAVLRWQDGAWVTDPA
jgi:ATP phosphoribosyltransferase regulatory subunit